MFKLRGKRFFAFLALGAVSMLTLACSAQAPASSSVGAGEVGREIAAAQQQKPVGHPVALEEQVSFTRPEIGIPYERGLHSVEPATGMEGLSGGRQYQALSNSAGGTQGVGLIATGTGSFSVAPDLATLRLGVESIASTVSEARANAAAAMTAVMAAVEEQGVEKDDVQTGYFSIQPRYTGREITRCVESEGAAGESGETGGGVQEGGTISGSITRGNEGSPAGQECFQEYQSVITGYQVTNNITVVVRDLEAVDDVIDEAVEAGGDSIRFNGLSFSLEEANRLSLEQGARASAVDDMQDRASELAGLAGVELGELFYLTEAGAAPPPVFRAQFAMAESAFDGAGVSTPIAPGEIYLEVSVVGRYLIAYSEESATP